jgi:hypothetical protein
MRSLCWVLLVISSTATGAGGWAAWHYQSVWIALVTLHGCWVTWRAVRAVIESHKLTCVRCKQWQPELTASGYCERCFWGNFQRTNK